MPIAAAATLMAVLASVLTQQHLAVAAHNPQAKMAEQAVARLDSGTDVRSIVPAKTIDMVSSSDPYLVVFDRARHVLISSAALHGRSPEFPASLFSNLPFRGEREITWQPETGVRTAVVVARWTRGFVLAGQSLGPSSNLEREVWLVAVLGWLASLSATALGAVLVGALHPLPSPTRRGEREPAAREPDPSPAAAVSERDRRRHRRQLLSPPRGQVSSQSRTRSRSSRSADRRCCTSQAGHPGSASRRWGTTWHR